MPGTSGPILLTATGGFALACYDTTDQVDDPGRRARGFVSDSLVTTGWFIGAIAEVPICREVNLRFEYRHSDYSSHSFALAGTTQTGHIDPTADEVRVGFSYEMPFLH
jgi:opacity protein-like surface antigen